MKLSELYGKRITAEDGKNSLTVMGVGCDGEKITCFYCFDGNGRELCIPSASVACTGGELKTSRRAEAAKGGNKLRLGRAAYSNEGKLLGIIKDCTLKGWRLCKAKIGRRSFDFSQLTLGDVIIVKHYI